MSPELVSRQPYGCQTDIWAFGVMLYRLVCRKNPFDSEDTKKLFEQVRSGIYQLDGTIQPDLRNLIRDCLQTDPSKRLTSTEILKH
jgi:serine/threonine protein kinase